ncbi:unnamed protein product, partial [Symbiodinium necroappetens]
MALTCPQLWQRGCFEAAGCLAGQPTKEQVQVKVEKKDQLKVLLGTEIWEIESESDVELLDIATAAPPYDFSQQWWNTFHACRSHEKFEQYRAMMKDQGVEVFTYIDKVVADKASFMKWVHETEKMEAASSTASQQMLGHPLFQSFCSEVGVASHQWGQEGADLTTEVSLFQEWVAAKELVNAGVVPPPPADVSMDTMETQVMSHTLSWGRFLIEVVPSMSPPPPPEDYATEAD